MGVRALFADTRPLHDPHFRRLWTANIITVIGAQLTVVAVPAQLYALTGNSAYVGLTGLFGLVPLVVFGLWGGALADFMDRRLLMVLSTIGLILTAAMFWLQAATDVGNVWLILTIFALQQAFFAINQPTRTSILPRLLPRGQLPAANSLNMTVMQFGAIAGPLVGGALIPVLGFSWLYLADTVFLLATLWAAVRLPALPPASAPTSAPAGVPGLRSVVEGFSYLRAQPVLMMSFLVDVIAMMFGMPRALFPQMAHESFGGPSEGGLAFALLFAAIPAGALLGGILSGWISRVSRQGRAVVLCIVVWGGAMVGFGLFVWQGLLLPALAMLALGGAADMASAAFRQTILQEAASDEVRGRLQGIFIVVVAGGPRMADTLHGAAAAVVGTVVATTGGGALVVIGVVLAALLVPAFVRYRVAR
ncbi:MFS-type transporter involved in bile tolerance, Atg22 family [Raineyella antarctica]|uniref:MFS-type transporter involved in bile tolerance, Atg22 family n=1 Tax=Raineyella antarctica TaxID=1577474 RepID=A0A1G6GG33_9ACTN|nr:MFS transporter [Raineyella antarctica]SDB80961.1 MFS-type transporter involved in bile tolerance, Atg22 family [Raineyella antarctica]